MVETRGELMTRNVQCYQPHIGNGVGPLRLPTATPPTGAAFSVTRSSPGKSCNQWEGKSCCSPGIAAGMVNSAADLSRKRGDQLEAGAAFIRVLHAAAVVGHSEACFAEADASHQLNADP